MEWWWNGGLKKEGGEGECWGEERYTGGERDEKREKKVDEMDVRERVQRIWGGKWRRKEKEGEGQ